MVEGRAMQEQLSGKNNAGAVTEDTEVNMFILKLQAIFQLSKKVVPLK